MPYQPISPLPYLTTIDAAKENVFACVINPRDVIWEYELRIIDNDTGENVLTITETTSRRIYTDKDSQELKRVTDRSELQLPLYGSQGLDTILEVVIPENYIIDKSDGNLSGETGELSGDGAETASAEDTSETQTETPSEEQNSGSLSGEEDDVSGSLSGDNTETKEYGDYVWNITLYDKNGNGVVSNDYFFMVRDTPTIVLKNEEQELSSVNENRVLSSVLDISGTYEQAQNIQISYYCFKLYHGTEVIHTTGDITSSNIFYKYEGLLSGNNYSLELTIYDDNNTQSVFEYSIFADYSYFAAPIVPSLTVDNDNGSINVDFSNNVSIIGQYNEEKKAPELISFKNSKDESIPETTNGVSVEQGQYILWNEKGKDVPLDLDDTTQAMYWHGHEGFNGVIIEKTDGDTSYSRIAMGHDVPVDFDRTSYTEGASVEAGFYYQYPNTEKTYISEFIKVAKANYTPEEYSNFSIDEETLYILHPNDTIGEHDMLVSNDMPNKYWWGIGLLKDEGYVSKGELFEDTEITTEVSE